MNNSSPFHEPVEHCRPKDSPSPWPSPAGRGRIFVRWLGNLNNKGHRTTKPRVAAPPAASQSLLTVAAPLAKAATQKRGVP